MFGMPFWCPRSDQIRMEGRNLHIQKQFFAHPNFKVVLNDLNQEHGNLLGMTTTQTKKNLSPVWATTTACKHSGKIVYLNCSKGVGKISWVLSLRKIGHVVSIFFIPYCCSDHFHQVVNHALPWSLCSWDSNMIRRSKSPSVSAETTLLWQSHVMFRSLLGHLMFNIHTCASRNLFRIPWESDGTEIQIAISGDCKGFNAGTNHVYIQKEKRSEKESEAVEGNVKIHV